MEDEILIGKAGNDVSILVSINCITYNHEEFIADAIKGFLMQKTDFKYEIVIGEDCSTDNTREIIGDFLRKYPDKIKLITSDQNVGASKNAQRVFKNSVGKYIAECEGDDYWIDPYKLQKQVDYLEKHPECTLCFHASQIVSVTKKVTGRMIKSYREDRQSPIEDIITGGGGFCPTASLIYPRKLMENPPLFFKQAHVGDYPMQLYLASQGYAYYINDCMSAYRIGVKDSWTNRLSSKQSISEGMVKVHEGDIKLLVGFNEFTNYKYSTVIEKTILKKEFEVLLLTGEVKELKSPKYKNHVGKLVVKEKLKVFLTIYFPKTYSKIIGFKDFVLNQKIFT